MRVVLGYLLTLTLLGCAQNAPQDTVQNIRALNERPLFAMSCPAGGCSFTELKVYNPDQVSLPKVTNGWDTANRLLDAGIAVAPWVMMYKSVKTLAAEVGNSTSGSYNSNSDDHSDHSQTDMANHSDNSDSSTHSSDVIDNSNHSNNSDHSAVDSSDHSTVDNSNNSVVDDHSVIDDHSDRGDYRTGEVAAGDL